MNDNDSDETKSFWGRVGRKPLPIQRILTENGPIRLKSQSNPEYKSKVSTSNLQEKENTKSFEASSFGPYSLEEDSSDQDWFSEAMSSTMAVSSLSTPNRLKAGHFSNLSSINYSGACSLLDGNPEDKMFTTPERGNEEHTPEAPETVPPSPQSTPNSINGQVSSPNSSPIGRVTVKTPGISIMTTPRTPSSSKWVSARTPTSSESMKTPHSSQKSPHSSYGRTPGYLTHAKTPNSQGIRTPSSGTGSIRSASSAGRCDRTPSSSSSSTRWNPFDSQHSVDMILQPTLSPNVFSTVISPSQETEASTGRFWSIDQQAEMFPTNISEDSPLKQSIYVKNYSKDLESKTQEQIELYFAEHHVITSPPDLPPTGPLIVESPSTSYIKAEKNSVAAWTQTDLTFPVSLPPQIEQILKQFCTFQDPLAVPVFSDEYNNLSNSTLRRKLFNADMRCSDSSHSPSPDSSPGSSPTSPAVILTPGRVIHTPITSKNPGLTSAQWSSSPVRASGRTTSFSPPDHMGSPMFSPIVKGKGSQSQPSLSIHMSQECVDSSVGGSEDMQATGSEVSGRSCSRDLTAELGMQQGDNSGELYQTAEIDTACFDSADASLNNMEVDGNSVTGWTVSHCGGFVSHSNTVEGWNSKSRTGDGWGVSTIGDTWTVSLPDDTEGISRDTAYATQNTASITNLTPSSPTPSPHPSLSRQDSGLGQQEASCSVSVVAPPVFPPVQVLPQENGVLMSYHAADGADNDISVGFPLGSSTPTKK